MCATSVYRVSRRSDLLLRIQVQMAGVPPTVRFPIKIWTDTVPP